MLRWSELCLWRWEVSRLSTWDEFFVSPFYEYSHYSQRWRVANDKRRPTSGKDRTKVKQARKQSRKDRRK